MARNVALESARNKKVLRWVLTVFAVLCAVLLYLLSAGYDISYVGPKAYAVGFVLSVLPIPIYVAIALFIERYEKEPTRMLAAAFFWGMSAAIFFATLGNQLTYLIVKEAFSDTPGSIFFVTVVSAPPVEELSKGLALFVLFWWKKDEFDNVIDGIVYAAMVGLGFAMVENFLYYGRSLAEGGLAGGSQTFVICGVLSPFSHPIFTSMTGIGLGLARQSGNTLVKFAAPVAGLTGAIVLHAIWNGSGYVLVGLLGLIFVFFVYTPLLIAAVLAVSFFALSREGRVIRQYLTPELQSGLVTRQEYDALASVRGRLASSFRALSHGGLGGWRARSRFAQAATELAFHRDRVARSITSADAAGREAAYVRLLSELKGPASARYLAE